MHSAAHAHELGAQGQVDQQVMTTLPAGYKITACKCRHQKYGVEFQNASFFCQAGSIIAKCVKCQICIRISGVGVEGACGGVEKNIYTRLPKGRGRWYYHLFD
jgi:hypothetical protein